MPAIAALSTEIALVVLVALPAAAVFVVITLVAVALTVVTAGVIVAWMLTRASSAVLGEGAEIWR
jgi:hypothetical protein